jgi:L-alanine-DL-glutamate epimerase-like enolase superfamily enzyme
MVEYLPLLYPALAEPPAMAGGQMLPPRRPGLGLEIRADAIEKYRVEM